MPFKACKCLCLKLVPLCNKTVCQQGHYSHPCLPAFSVHMSQPLPTALCHDVQINCTPQLTFYADTRDFCAQLSLYEAILVVVYLIFATGGCLLGLAVFDKLDYFGFYKVRGGIDYQVFETLTL